MVQATRAYDAWNSVWNVGRATLTTVTSRIDMMAPKTTTPAILNTWASSLVDAVVAWSCTRLSDPRPVRAAKRRHETPCRESVLSANALVVAYATVGPVISSRARRVGASR